MPAGALKTDVKYLMRKSIASIIIALCSLLASGQGVHKSLLDNPDLGLHGNVTWVSSTTIRVEYDWSDDSQLADWIPTHQSQLVRGNGS